ncbi:MAG: glycosyltransferase family 4 protein [Candidatus Roizmanbacteria bacterium]|nr:glycosyltransferase family 4 protein [Candidatus Roizmanbacteria bacterium]
MPKKKLKVLYLSWFPFYGSGSGTYARYLAIEVNKSQDVAIVSPDIRPINGVKLYPLKTPFRVAFTGHPEWPNCKLFTDISHRDILRFHKSALDSVVDAVEDFKPDIIHVHHAYPLSWSARFVKSTYQIPYVITVHGSELPTAQKDKRYIALTMDALRKAKKIIPNSAYTKDWAIDVFGNEFQKNMRVIPGGVDIKQFKKVNTDKITSELNLSGKKTVLFAGKLTKYKGVEYLIKAAKKIHGDVVISGDGPEKKNLLKIITDEHITNVHFVGHVDSTERLVELYSMADVFVAPSVWDEPLGLVVLEAMATETPVVVTRKGGIPLAVKDGKNGFFIRSRNATDIALKVNKLLDDDNLRKKMGATARTIAVERFAWPLIAEKFISIYKKYS